MFDSLKQTHLYRSIKAKNKYFNRAKFPNIVMIQTASMCNADCICCPYPYLNKEKQLVHGIMSDELFDRILAELRQYNPPRVSPYWNNEPMIDPKFLERTEKMRAAFTDRTVLHISTNGSRLNKEAWPIVANTLDMMHISAQGGVTRPERYKVNMPGIIYEEVVENITGFVDYLKNNDTRLKLNKISINNVLDYDSEEDMNTEKTYWDNLGVRLNIGGFNSFSGSIKVQEGKKKSGRRIYGCLDKDRPLQGMHILANGDCVICCNDWVRELVLGDANKQSLAEIWHSAEYVRQSKAIYSGQEMESHMCSKCDLALIG